MPSYSLQDLLLLIQENGGPGGLDLEHAGLAELDASPQALEAELERLRAEDPEAQPAWLSPETGGLNLQEANLEHADLSRARLDRANLRGAQLRAASLAGADLAGASLGGADAHECDLQGARLPEASLEGASLKRANLDQADLEGARFEGANLKEASLVEARLARASLEGATLKRANLERADLQGANLEGANLREASLVEAGLAEASLEGANLRGANLARAGLAAASLEGANLREATLTDAGLERAMLPGANLRSANLSQANLRAANLTGARLREADLSNASLEDARLVDADLSEANLEGVDLSTADLEGARFDGGEAGDWPPGVEDAARMAHDAEAMAEQIAHDVSSAAAGAAREAAKWASIASAFEGEGESGHAEGGEFSLNIPLEGATGLHLDVGLGNIDLTAEEREDILLRGSGSPQDDLEIRRAEDTIHIRQRKRDRPRGWLGLRRQPRLDLQVALPASLAELEARTGLGNLHARSLQVRGRLAAGKGNVHLTGSRLDGEVTTGLGNVDLVESTASMARTGCGNVHVRGAGEGRLEATTGSGNVDIRVGRLDGLKVSTGAGNVDAALALSTGEYRLASGAGVLTVEISGDPSMQVEAITGMGKVTSDWPLVRVGRPGPAAAGSTRMVGSIGDETRRARLVLRTGLGNVNLRRPSGAPQPGPAPEPEQAAQADPVAEPAPDEPPTADSRMDILTSLARGEITVDEAEALINQLAAQE